MKDSAMKKKEYHFYWYCNSCKRQHRMVNKPCPSCGGRGDWTPQPVSDKVADGCSANYECDGCLAYREHMNPW